MKGRITYGDEARSGQRLANACLSRSGLFTYLGAMMTREIQLTRGYVALVDDEDFEWINGNQWYPLRGPRRRTTYAFRRELSGGRSRGIYMHREILAKMYGEIQGKLSDHANMNGLDNRRGNLRLCSNVENHWNMSKQRTPRSPYKGTYKVHDKWMASITVYRTFIRLGLFPTAEEAALAYDRAATEHFGSFARTNGMTEEMAEMARTRLIERDSLLISGQKAARAQGEEQILAILGELREGGTYSDLARRAGIDKTLICRIRQGARGMSERTLSRLTLAFPDRADELRSARALMGVGA